MIPIFEGKQATYNKAILEALLLEGEMSTWQLAKDIAPKIKTVRRTMQSTKTQKVYSVLIRKNGRLDDLKSKEYVNFNEEKQKWEIIPKGMIAICIEKPKLQTMINPQHFRFVIGSLNIPKEKVKLPFYGITINGKQLERDLSKLLNNVKTSNVWVVKKIVAETQKLIDEGLNFDKISTSSLMVLLWKKRILDRNAETTFLI